MPNSINIISNEYAYVSDTFLLFSSLYSRFLRSVHELINTQQIRPRNINESRERENRIGKLAQVMFIFIRQSIENVMQTHQAQNKNTHRA